MGTYLYLKGPPVQKALSPRNKSVWDFRKNKESDCLLLEPGGLEVVGKLRGPKIEVVLLRM